MESFVLEETLKGHLVQLSCSEQGHLQLEQGAQNPLQPALDCLQRGGIHHLSGLPVLVLYYSYGKKLLPYI